MHAYPKAIEEYCYDKDHIEMILNEIQITLKLRREAYDKRWLEKLNVYNSYFPGQLIKTYKSAPLSQSTTSVINRIKRNDE